MFGFKKRRRNRLAAQQFPDEWMAIIERNVPFYRLLPEADQKELQRHIQIFISEKRFEGCGGLKITDEIKVTIAAQACMLLLHRRTDYYPGLHSILVYPRSYVAPRIPKLVGGVVVEGPDHPVAVRRHLAIMVMVNAVRVREAHQVEPILGHVLAVLGLGQQAIHQTLVGVRRGIGEKGPDFLAGRRQAGEIKTQPANYKNKTQYLTTNQPYPTTHERKTPHWPPS